MTQDNQTTSKPTEQTDPAKPVSSADVLEKLGQVASSVSMLVDLKVDTEREDRRWKVIKRFALGAMFLFGVGVSIALYAPLFGWTTGPAEAAVGVVPISGEIGRGQASANQVAPAITRACEAKLTRAVIVRINSGGGSPTDAERIAGAFEACRREGNKKPVVAVIEGVGASAAYMIAIEADEVVASRYSLVGSIGAVMRSFDASPMADKLGFRERVYASGALKGGNSAWTPNSPEQDQVAQQLVDDAARLFVDQVRARRGEKLKSDPDLFSGRVWVGAEAVQLGLIDGSDTYEGVLRSRYQNLAVHEFRPTQTFQDRLAFEALFESSFRQIGRGVAEAFTSTGFE